VYPYCALLGKCRQFQQPGQAVEVGHQLRRQAYALRQCLATQGKAGLPGQAYRAFGIERAARQDQAAKEAGFVGERLQATEEAWVNDHGSGRGAPLLRGILAPMAGQAGRQGFDQQRQGKAFVAKGLAAERQDAASGRHIRRSRWS